MSDHNSTSDIFVSFGLGLFVGAATALLLAPAAGRETRRRLGEFGQGAIEKARTGMANARAFAGDQAQRVERALDEGKEAFRTASH
jgi:gas vesicle protein